MTQAPVFVVASTGRCGSTLLSDVLALHPQVLSVSEFLVPLFVSGVRQAQQAMSARDFCAALQTQMPTTTALLRAGITVPEFRYPFHREGARYTAEGGVPFAVNSALSRLTDDPDSAFDTLLDHVMAANGSNVAEHLDCTFGTLAAMFGGSVLVERSGGSLVFAAGLRALLPQARFVLLTRNGPETAVSMSRHPYFRHIALRSVLGARLGYDPYTSSRRDGAAVLPSILQRQMPEQFKRDGFDALDLPLDLFGAMWAQHTESGLSLLPDQFDHLAFEALCTAPSAALAHLARALGVAPHRQWIDAAQGQIGTLPRNTHNLPQADLSRLERICSRGTAALARKGIY